MKSTFWIWFHNNIIKKRIKKCLCMLYCRTIRFGQKIIKYYIIIILYYYHIYHIIIILLHYQSDQSPDSCPLKNVQFNNE